MRIMKDIMPNTAPQLAFSSVIPIMTYPIAAPNDPVPSMIPTTVPIDFSLELSYFNLPRSAHEIPDIIATAPPINSPKMKMKKKNANLYAGSMTIRKTCITVASRMLTTARGVLLL